MFKLRDYQKNIVDKAVSKLYKLRIILLAMEVRTGKTLTSLSIAEKMNFKKVLFVTKKKAISSIKSDYDLLNPSYFIKIINYESIHKITEKDFDLVIVDESHSLGAFPKPSLRTKRLKELIGNKYVILLSGTPTPESYSQIYHQFWISEYSPFVEKSFYKWANNFVNIKKVYIAHGNQANDYSNANKKLIDTYTRKHIISYSQKDAGFKSNITEEIISIYMSNKTYNLVNKLERDLVLEGKSGVILGDTPVKLMQKVHQLYSGTCKLEDGTSVITDDTKALHIYAKFKGQKIAIFYKFKEELNLLKQVFDNNLTTDLEEFNTTNKNIALQIVSGREGISLKKADALVMYNIDFSATSYWQARDRMTTKDRSENKVYWIFSKGGLEEKIYQKVKDKKSYTTKYYEREQLSKQVNQVA